MYLVLPGMETGYDKLGLFHEEMCVIVR